MWMATAIACVSIMLFPSISTVSVESQGNMSTQSPPSPKMPPCDSAARSEFNKLNVYSAIHSAQDSQAFKLIASSFEKTLYISSFMITEWEANCVPGNEIFNPVFSAYDASGFEGYIVASENPSTLAVVGVSTQMHPGKLDYCGRNGNPTPCNLYFWAGYEARDIHYDANYNVVVNSATTVVSNFYQARPWYPPGGCANFYTCNVAQWVGLEGSQFAYPDQNLAQAGTYAICQYSGCTPHYMGAYEWNPSVNPLIDCNGYYGSSNENLDIWEGDQLQAVVENTGNSQYYFSIYNYRNGRNCYSSNNSYPALPNPTLTAFEVENLKDCNDITHDCDSLAQFTGASFNNALFWDAYQGRWIYLGYANWLWNDTMVNCGTLNVSTGSIGGTNLDTFTETWQSSQNTPYWNTGC